MMTKAAEVCTTDCSLNLAFDAAVCPTSRSKNNSELREIDFTERRYVTKDAQVRMAAKIKKQLPSVRDAWADQLVNLESPTEDKTLSDEMGSDAPRLLRGGRSTR